MYTIAPARLLLRPTRVWAEDDNVLASYDVILVLLEQMRSKHPLQEGTNGALASP